MAFLAKTISAEELQNCAWPDYFHYMIQSRDSLLNRVVLCGTLVPPQQGGALHFVVLENILPPHPWTPLTIFDLKGSSLGRKTSPQEAARAREGGGVPIMKDLDVQETKLQMTPDMAALFVQSLSKDCEFLQRHNVMDYSLLLALCAPPPPPSLAPPRRASQLLAVSDFCTCCGSESAPRDQCPQCRLAVCVYCCDPRRNLSPCHLCCGFEACPYLGVAGVAGATPVTPPRHASVFRADGGGFRATSADGAPLETVYFMGIIDFLQPYNMRKQVESRVKTVLLAGGDELQISVLSPERYAQRLVSFVRRLV